MNNEQKSFERMTNSIEFLKDNLKQLSTDAHALMNQAADDEERDFERALALGRLTSLAAVLRSAHILLLYWLGVALLEIEDHEPQRQSEPRVSGET